jgi:alkanesulfonate monooxygenase SsuD/methylene tetrahydromethanopterin reductase-like flavin-dependent oxidoreductase (luciferase family)
MNVPVRFGLNVDPNVGGLAIAERMTAIADRNDLDLVGIQDHPYNSGFVDTMSLITALVRSTSRVHLFPNVANLLLRPPAMLAKQAASIDVLSGGRFELGLGAGGFVDHAAGMGGPRRSVAQGRAALSEAIDIIRAMWAGKPFSFTGDHYTTPAVRPGPPPKHDISLWLGVTGPKSVRLVGAKADGWSISAPFAPPSQIDQLNPIIDEAAHEAGRDPDRIVRLYNVMGLIADVETDAFNGPVERWVDTLTRLHVDHRMNAFVYWPAATRERQAHLFAEEVVPAVRKALDGV